MHNCSKGMWVEWCSSEHGGARLSVGNSVKVKVKVKFCNSVLI